MNLFLPFYTPEVCLRVCECVCVRGHGYVCVCARARLRACAPCRGAREGRELLCRCGPAPAASGCSLGERLDVLASGFRGLLLLWGRGETAGLLPSPLMGALPAPRDLPAGPPQAASAHCPDMLPAGVDYNHPSEPQGTGASCPPPGRRLPGSGYRWHCWTTMPGGHQGLCFVPGGRIGNSGD